MNDEELKALQAPLKDRYRSEPDAAVVTLEAEGRLGEENITCKVSTGKAMVEAGLHPATGGDGVSACSGAFSFDGPEVLSFVETGNSSSAAGLATSVAGPVGCRPSGAG